MSKKITTATNDDDDDDNDDNDDKAIIISSTIPSNLKNQPSSSKDKNRQLLLWQWATHQHESFHNFNPDEATEIRQCLLEWYRANRRKLPWRGDAGPFDGSTAGINNGNGKKGTKRKIQGGVEKSNKGQKSIKSFFKEGDESSSSSSSSNKKKKKDEESVTRRRSARQRIKAESNEEDTATSCSSSTPMNSQGDVMISENKPIPMTGYSVWVSEIMLQQTRVEAVIPYYLKWMKSFPTVHALANATEEEVNSHWAGLGFYRRARLLHKGAKYVSKDLNGTMPQTVDDLMKISGIGRYTASAIASIAFNTCVPVVDGNVCRVLSRLKGIANHIKAPVFKDGMGWDLADQIVKAGDGLHAGEVNQAMMELGATYCAPSGTGIGDNDPLKKFYMSTRIGEEVRGLIQSSSEGTGGGVLKDPIDIINEYVSNASDVRGEDECSLCDSDGISSIILQIATDLKLNCTKKDAARIGHANFPTSPPKKTKREEVLAIAVISIHVLGEDTKWLMVKRPKVGLLAGQWEFPSACVWSSANEQKNGPSAKSKSKGKEVKIPKFSLKSRRKPMMQMLEQFCFPTSNIDKESSSLTAAHLWQLDPNCKVVVVNEQNPIEHVFSHVRHSMWIEHGSIKFEDLDIKDHDSFLDSSYHLGDGRQFKWMSDTDMKKAGITSAIKKILKQLHS